MSPWVNRLSTIASAAVLAAAIAACGDSDNEDQPAKAGTDVTEPAAVTDPGKASAGAEPAPAPDRDGSAPRGEGGGRVAGGSGGGEATGDGASGGATSGGDSADRDRVAQVVSGMYEDFAKGDAAGVCAAMSESVRRQIAAEVFGGSTEPPADRTCEQSLSKFVDAAAASGIREGALAVTVKGVRIDGDRAVATVSLGGRAGQLRLVSEDGEWRFGDSPLN